MKPTSTRTSFYTTKMNRIAGLPNTDSNRAFDMFMKTRYIRELTGGRGVVFATGTPISNTMAEMYTMLRYLGPDLLQERGVEHFDAWAANFAEAVTALELAPDGSGYRMHTRFAKFVNLPELLSMFRTFSDVQTADMLNLPRPSVDRRQAAGHRGSGERDAQGLRQDADRTRRAASRTGASIPRVDNMLKITGDGRKAALDMRLVDAFADAHGDTKLSARRRAHPRDMGRDAATSARRSSSSATSRRPTQTASTSMTKSAPGSSPAAFPKQEIAFIHDADTDARQDDAVQRRERRARAHPHRLHRKDGRGHERAAPPCAPCIISTRPGGRATSSSARAEFCGRAISIPKSRFTATSRKARSTPICGRPSKPRPASSSR